MSIRRNSYFINSSGPNVKAIEDGFTQLIRRLQELGGGQTVYLAVPSKKNLDGVIKEVLGEKLVRVLNENNETTLPQGLGKIVLLTERNVSGKYSNGLALVIYPSKKILDIIDDCANLTEVLVIPWNVDYDVPEWIRTWNAIELGKKIQQEKKPLIDNPVIIEALKALIDTINVSTGISHPSDKGATINLFKILYKAKEEYDAKQVRAWLIAEGNLSPKFADDIAYIAQAVLDKKPIRSEIASWSENILNTWRSRAGRR